mmetsp:Transcript_2069/g.6112  ORF Transcript_2069/g.6112 Transcript_2069/m.6112 type:complete len:515 (+) Transcript_2069:3-1547(+)
MVQIPFTIAFEPDSTAALDIFNFAIFLFWVTDFLLAFFTGAELGNGIVVMNPALYIPRYLRTWFVLDAIIVGLDMGTLFLGIGQEAQATQLGRSLRTLRFIRSLRLVRLLKLKRLFQQIQDYIMSEAIAIYWSIIKIVMGLIAANHMIACLWYFIGISEERKGDGKNWVRMHGMLSQDIAYRYMTALHWSLVQFTPASMEIFAHNVFERMFTVSVLLFALIAFSSFVSSITAATTQLRNMKSDETRQFWLLRRYLKECNITRTLTIKVQRYLEYAYQQARVKVQEKEVALLALLSAPLRNELKHGSFAPHINRHVLFHYFGRRSLSFMRALKAVMLARDDVQFSIGEEADRMLFLTDGHLEYSTEEHTEFVAEGEIICEGVLWTPWEHYGDLVATTECQLIGLDHKEFQAVVLKQLTMCDSVQGYASAYVKALNKIDADQLSDLLGRVISSAQVFQAAGITGPGARAEGGTPKVTMGRQLTRVLNTGRNLLTRIGPRRSSSGGLQGRVVPHHQG